MSQEKTMEQLKEENELLHKEILEWKNTARDLKNVINLTPVGIGVLQDRVFQWINKDFENMLGYSTEELNGQYSRLLYPSEQEYKRVGIVVYGQVKEEGRGSIESRMVHKNGNVIEVLISAAYLNKEGQKKNTVVMIRDVTEQKKVENKLKISADDWNRTFDAIPDMISIHDEHNTIIHVNKAFVQSFNLEIKEDAIGKKCYEVIHKTKTSFANCPFEISKKDYKSHSLEIDHPDMGVPLLITSSPIFDEDHKLLGVVHIMKDISEMRLVKQEVDKRIKTLERFHSVSVGRELKMKELKERIKDLEKKLDKDEGQG